MKKNLYYNNYQFYAAVFVAVDQILRLHSCEATLPFAHEGPAHSFSRPEQAEARAALLRKQAARTPQ